MVIMLSSPRAMMPLLTDMTPPRAARISGTDMLKVDVNMDIIWFMPSCLLSRM